jgi:hypothetical protein
MEVKIYCEEHEFVHNFCHLFMDNLFPLYVIMKDTDTLGSNPELIMKKRHPPHNVLFPEATRVFSTKPIKYVKEHKLITLGEAVVEKDGKQEVLPYTKPQKKVNPDVCSCSNVGQYQKKDACDKFHYIRISNRRFFDYVPGFTDYILKGLKIDQSVKPNQITVAHRPHMRKVLNRSELLNELGTTGMPTQEVTLEKLKLKEQLNLMRKTKVFVAMHGAALTHALFLPEESIVIEILPYGYVYDRYEKLSVARGLGDNYVQWRNPDISKTKPHWSRSWLGNVDTSITPVQQPSIIKKNKKRGTELNKANKLRGWFRDQDTEVNGRMIKNIIVKKLKLKVN